MPSVEHMNNVTSSVINNMNAVSDEANASLQATSFVEDERARQFAYESEQTQGAVDALLNLGASAVEGATRTAGEIAAIPANVEAASLLGVPQDILDAYLVTRNPEATPEQQAEAQAKLGQRVKQDAKAPSFGTSSAIFAMDTTTYEQKINNALKASKDAAKIVDTLSVSGLVKQGNRQELQKDLSNSFANIEQAWKSDDVNGLQAAATSVAETIKSLGSNPLAVGEYAVESIPGALTGLVGSAGYGLDVFNEALTKYQEENDGNLPSKEDLGAMAAWSAGAGALDKIGDTKLVKAITETTKGGAKGVAKNLAGTTVTEGVTEGAQTASESKAKLEEIDAEEVYSSAAIGAAAGATISGTGEAVKGTAKLATKGTETIAAKNKAFAEKRNEQKSAIESGDVSKFTDVSSPSYSLKESVETLSKAAAKNPEKQAEFYETAKEQTLSKRAELISMQEELLEVGTKEQPTEADAKRVKELESAISKLQPEVDRSIDLVRGMKPSQTEVTKDVEAATQGDAEAAKRSFGSFRVDPDTITADQADALADADNGLTEQENTELRNHANVQRSLESLDSVGSHIVDGGISKDTGREMMGIKDYRDMIVTATSPETKKAGVTGLTSFMNRHIDKATAIENAFKVAQETGQVQSVNIGSGKKLNIHRGSGKLVNTVRAEANALRAAYEAYAVPVLTTQEAPEVVEQPEVVQPQAEVETTAPEAVQEDVVSTEPVVQESTQLHEKKDVREKVESVVKNALSTFNKGIKEELASIDDALVDGTFTQEEAKKEKEFYNKFIKAGNKITVLLETAKNSVSFAEAMRKSNTFIEDIKEILYEDNLTSEEVVEAEQVLQQFEDSITDYGQQEMFSTSPVDTESTVVSSPSVEQVVSPEVAEATLSTTSSTTVVETPAVPSQPVPEQEKDYSLAKMLTSKEDTANLVSEYFKPSNKKSVLNKTNDFLARLKGDTANTLAQAYPEGVTTEATVVANNFARFNTAFNNNLDSIFEVKGVDTQGRDFRADDYVQYLVDETGQLPANVKTAMAVGAYEWLIANGKESTIKTQDSIKSVLGLTEEDYFEPELYNVMPVGSRRTSIVNSMGTAAFRALNLKMDTTAPIDAQTRLETAMGLWAYEALRKANVLQEAEVKGAAIKNTYGYGAPKAIKDIKPTDAYVMATLNATPAIEAIIETNREKSSFMMDVFGSMSERPMPSFKSMKGNYKVSKSSQQVPEAQRKVLEEDQKKPYFLRSDTVGSFFEFEPDLRNEMMGYVSDLSGVMDVNKPAVEGANRSIERELEIAQEWYMEVQNQDAGIDTPFYLPHTVWKQGRMGLGTRFNPQSSKIHRYLTNRGEWNHTFDFGSEGENYFLLAVGEGFDIEVPKFATDSESTSSQKALDKLTEKLAKPEIRNAIEAMKDIMAGNNTRENQELVATGVKAGEGKMKSYLSIVEMAKYENAKNQGDKSFSHTLAREVDGITNGVCITTLQFSHDNMEQMFKLLQRMGIYDTELTYNEWKANPANKDSYVSLAEAWEQAIAKDLQSNPALNAKYIEVSKLLGGISRNLAKGPLMTSIYGAGIATIVDHLGSETVNKVYENLQKAYDTKNSQLIKDTLATVNKLTGSNYKITKGDEVLTFKLNKKDVKAIKDAVAAIYSDSLDDAMALDYQVSFESRTKLNAASNFAHEMFIQMYNAELAKYEVVTNEVQAEVLEKLKQVTPIVNTANSKLSSKDLDTQLNTGLMLSGFEMTPAPEDVKVTIKGKFGNKKSSTAGGQLRTFKAPGAAPIPTMTQSIDAATQVQMLKNVEVLNVHDASYISGNNFAKDKSVYNQGFLSVNYQYSIPQEVAQMLYRVAEGFKASGLELSPEAIKAAKPILGKEITDIDALVGSINDLAANHMQSKQKVMKSIVRSEQYSNGDDSAFVPKHKFGSSAQTVLEENYTFDDVREIDNMSTEEVFDKLQQVSVVKDSQEHLEHLRDVLTNVVNQGIKPFNLHIGSSKDTETIGSTDGADMFIVNQTTDALPTSGSLANGIRMSSSEVFVHELVHNVTMVGVEQKMAERNELVALWHQAKKVVTIRDFMNNPTMSETDPAFKDEYDAAKSRWEHVFKPSVAATQKGRRKSNHLHEFVALGMTNANFRKALNKIEFQNQANQVNEATGTMGRLAQGIYNWFQKLLATIQSKMLSTYGKNADAQLEELFKAFAGVDSSAKNVLKSKALRVVQPAQNFVETQSEKIAKVMQEPVNKFKGQASAKVKQAVESGKVQTLTDIVGYGYNELKKSSNTAAELFLSTVTEARGRYNYVGLLHDMKRMANKNIDRFRMQVRTDYRTAINEAFKDKLTVEQRSALSYGLLKTDIASLDMTEAEVLNLFSNVKDLNTKIAELENQLKGYEGYGNYYIRQAKNLGQFMMTGKHYIPNAMLNAENIADALGTHRSMPSHAAQAKPVIDTLTTLYAIKAIPSKEKTLFNSLVREDLNGITFSMNIAKEYAKKSAAEFKDNSRHMTKGFMTDKVDPNIAIKAGTLDDQAEMEAQGYSLGSALPKDPNDPNRETTYLYVNNMGGIPANIGGVAYLMTDTHRGTDVVMNPTSSSNVTETEDFEGMAKASRADTISNWSSSNLSSKTYASPLVNQDGEIINYRYVMSDQVKDEILHRDSSFDDVMGIMMSNLAVKDDMRKQNTDLVKVLKKMYDEDTANRDQYVLIGKRSSNPEYREIFRMLPRDMQEEIKALGLQDGMFVRKDVIDLLFGYHKYTLANLWKLDKSERKLYQQMFTGFVEMIFGKKAAMRVRQGEELMQALAKTVKDIIVIKSGMVTLGNMLSNVVLLKMMGVPLKDIIKGHKDSYAAMRKYKKQNQELEQVRIKLASSNLTNNQRTVYESRMLELEDDMAANPVVDMIDQGLLSTIVEDIDTEVEEYKLRQKVKRKAAEAGWEEKLEDATNRIPKGLRDVAKEALVMQGSNLYDFLSEAAQFSDFGARYVLYKNKVEKGMTPEEAAGYVMDIFIDYDLPTHKGIQYLNDMGMLMFSKYLLRVQRIIAKTFLENPARATMIMLLQNWLGDIPDIMDSTMIVETNPLTRIANPVESFFGAAPDIITMKPFS